MRKPAISKRTGLLVWAAFHLLLLLAFLARGSFALSADLADMVPSSGEGRAVAQVARSLSSEQGKQVTLLFSSTDWDAAKSAALAFQNQDGDLFVSFEQGGAVDVAAISEELGKWKWQLLDPETRNLVQDGKSAQVRDDALSMIYGTFTFHSLDNLEHDPFLLGERESRALLSVLSGMSKVAPKDGLLAAQSGGTWYAMVRGTLRDEVRKMSNRTDIERLFSDAETIASSHGARVFFSGVSLHTWESTQRTKAEVTLISTASIIAVLLLFLIAFHSLSLVLLFLADILLAALTAVLAGFAAFGTLHLLTLVFVTSLIGTCVDYSVHFAVHSLGSGDPLLVRDRMLKSVSVSFLSTLFCYGLLALAPYTPVKEIAVCCMAGLSSSYLTSMFLYPWLFERLPLSHIRLLVLPKRKTMSGRTWKLCAVLLLGGVALLAALSLPRLHVANDIASLYTMSDRMKKGEVTLARATGLADSATLIVSGQNENEVLEHEERFIEKANEARLGHVLATSIFVPSEQTQRENLAASGRLLDEELDTLSAYLELDASVVRADWEEMKGRMLRVEDLPPGLGSLLGQLWLGRVGDGYYSVLLVAGPKDPARLETLADECEGVWYLDTRRAVSSALDQLSRQILILLFCSLVVVPAMLGLSYGWKRSALAMLSPLVILLGTLGAMMCIEGSVGFFTVSSLVLVLGLGLDYVVFVVDAKNTADEQWNKSRLALWLSFLTTLVSFGTLALSSFAPTRLFGLSTSVGLLLAFVFAALVSFHRS